MGGCPSDGGGGGTTDRTRIQELSDQVATQSRQIEMQREQIDDLSARLQRVQTDGDGLKEELQLVAGADRQIELPQQGEHRLRGGPTTDGEVERPPLGDRERTTIAHEPSGGAGYRLRIRQHLHPRAHAVGRFSKCTG